MIYRVEVKEQGRSGTWDVYHIRAKNFKAMIEKVDKKLSKTRVKLVIKSITETDLKVS